MTDMRSRARRRAHIISHAPAPALNALELALALGVDRLSVRCVTALLSDVMCGWPTHGNAHAAGEGGEGAGDEDADPDTSAQATVEVAAGISLAQERRLHAVALHWAARPDLGVSTSTPLRFLLSGLICS